VSKGPLVGVRIIEIASIGPGPFAAMMLADAGAEIIRVDRPQPSSWGGLDPRVDLLNRGRRSIALDLKAPGAYEVVLRLIEGADALIEGFRPGVAERLGIGPEICLKRNPRLVYGRMTGYGQDGPLANSAGHDIDYIALAGALYPIGRAGEVPVPPLNLVADFGGGGMLMAFGIATALLSVARTGEGQVVDAAMVDGVALLTTMLHGLLAGGMWREERGSNLLDTGAPFYEVYETKDGQFVAVGALEPQFYRELLSVVGLSEEELPPQEDADSWPRVKQILAEVFKTKSRDEWCSLSMDRDACIAPVLSPLEAPRHSHNQARGSYVEKDGLTQPAPAPRFSRTPSALGLPPPVPGEHTEEILLEAGYSHSEIEELISKGVASLPVVS